MFDSIVLFLLATLIGWVSILTWAIYNLMQQLKKAKRQNERSVFENLGD
jgi:hypothetical protein